MPATLYISGYEEIPEVFASVEEDFRDVELQPFMAKQLDVIADWERGLFEKQQSPDGTAWAPNSPSTIAAKGHSMVLRGKTRPPQRRRKGVKVPREFSRFRLSRSLVLKAAQSVGDAIREAVEDTRGAALRFGTTVWYSVFHDRGTSQFPARQHVGVDEQFIDDMADRIGDYMVHDMAKG